MEGGWVGVWGRGFGEGGVPGEGASRACVVGVREKRGAQYSTLNSRSTLIMHARMHIQHTHTRLARSSAPGPVTSPPPNPPKQTVKRVSLELGGNAPLVVLDDADLAQAARGVVASALRNSGQTCICANRVFVAAKARGGQGGGAGGGRRRILPGPLQSPHAAGGVGGGGGEGARGAPSGPYVGAFGRGCKASAGGPGGP
jgi:hypothetical protein